MRNANNFAHHKKSKRRHCLLAAMAIGSLSLAGCAGGVSDAAARGGGNGVEIGASKEEFREALSEMEQTTLVYQVGAQSPNHITAWRSHNFKDAVEDWSGGKIEIELQYSQSIAPYSEIDSALVDGRIDIAYMLPIYDPSSYPVSSALVAGSALAGTSPMVDELAAQAALTDVAWNTPELIDEFESKGLTVLQPISLNGPVFPVCSDGGSSEADWRGRQVRVSSKFQEQQLGALESTPVSLEHAETYEALQRGTVDCTLTSTMPAVDQGFIDVAPYVTYADKVGFGRGPGALIAGKGFQELPLAAQQLIFDRMGEYFTDSRRSDLQGNANAAKAVRENGGDFLALDKELEEKLIQQSNQSVEQLIDEGVVGEDFKDRLVTSLDKWKATVEELGYTDAGGFEDFDQWYADGKVDFAPLTERLDEEVREAHRPS